MRKKFLDTSQISSNSLWNENRRKCSVERLFRLPAILVGDGRLGGISGTISAYESLKLRGYDVVAVVF
ncbi:hypothetical protein ACH5RR_000897 [Cinchona calisaya]|uniref:Uncharacterized protein n=1 Tax=Cinchona calisaya TaxID=153742 RepID=A0ABD3B2E5_9GENT